MGYEIDFLAVGENSRSGDAITLRYGNLFGSRGEQTVVVIDGGFSDDGRKIVEFIQTRYGTDRVDLVISTHPDDDHANGLIAVLQELEVGQLWMHLPWNHTDDIARMFRDGRVTDNSVREHLRRSLDTARSLERIATELEIPIREPFHGLSLDEHLRVLGPSEEYYESLLPDFRGTPEPVEGAGLLGRAGAFLAETVRKVAESWNVETLTDEGETSAENNTSAILELAVDGDRVLMTADAGIPALTRIVGRLEDGGWVREDLRLVQVPHHGSQRNVGPTLLNRLIGPKIPQDEPGNTVAYVSAAKDGGPKHPSRKVTNAFRRRGVRVYATQGKNLRYHREAPGRSDYSRAEPLEFFSEVEE